MKRNELRRAGITRPCVAGVTLAVAVATFFAASQAARAERICFGRQTNSEECVRLCATKVAADLRPRVTPLPVPTETEAHKMPMGCMPGMKMPESPAAELLMQEASGTSLNPASSPMAMSMLCSHGWRFSYMGDAFLTETQQSGPRGSDKLFSTNVFMSSAEHALGRGSIVIEGMFSLEPATVTERRYPLLFQTGETAFGVPIEDGQHPHNFFMGLGVHYARQFGKDTVAEVYFAPVGDPALGPLAFPHRASAAELPQAPIGHHWEDSTHISYEVATVGIRHKFLRVEASGYHGAEPDEHRWGISTGAMDSWSARLSILPTRNWIAQVSVGRLSHPEALEPGDVVRTTAWIEYSRPIGESAWSTSFIFGRNHKTATAKGTNAFLIESVVPFRRENFFTGRWELVDKDELFAAQPAIEQKLASTVGNTFRIGAYTLGYTRYVRLLPPVKTGIGANLSFYTLPSAIVPFYGAHPFGVNVYLHLQSSDGGR